MAAQPSPQLEAVGEANPKQCLDIPYATALIPKQSIQDTKKTSLNPVQLIHGEPTVTFSMEERHQFVIEEGLHQAVVIKLSYGAPDLKTIRSILPNHFGTKGNCLIGQLAPRQILVRFDQYDDFVQALSRSVNYIHLKGEEHQIRIFPWSIGYNPKEETTKAVVWISLPNLSAELFAKKSLLSIASAIGKPIAIDKATQTKSRPSTARVKVILDLMEKLPNRVKIQFLDSNSGKLVEWFQEVVYDNLPAYCKFCKHQGHEETCCRLILQRKQKLKQTDAANDDELKNNVAIEKYQGDAREILNEKRRNGRLDHTAMTTSAAGNSGQELITAAGVDNIASVESGKQAAYPSSGQQQPGNTGAIYKSSTLLETKGATDTGKRRDQGIAKEAIPDPVKTGLPIPVLADEVVMEREKHTEDNAGQQLVARVSNVKVTGDQAVMYCALPIIDPLQSVSVDPAMVEVIMEKVGQTKTSGQMLVKGLVNSTADQNIERKQNTDIAPIVNKGKEVQVYVEKRHPPLSLKKPTGITIHEPNNPASIPVVERLQGRKVGIPTVEDELRGTAAVQLIEVTGERNKAQQNTTVTAGTHGDGILLAAGTDSAKWTVATKRKSRRPSTNFATETTNLEQLTEAGNHFSTRDAMTGPSQQLSDVHEQIEKGYSKSALMNEDNPAQSRTEIEVPPIDISQDKGNANRNSDGDIKFVDDTDINMASDVGNKTGMSASDKRQNNVPTDCAAESTTNQGQIAKAVNTDTMEQISETPGQTLDHATIHTDHIMVDSTTSFANTGDSYLMDLNASDQGILSQTTADSPNVSVNNSSHGNCETIQTQQIADIKLMNKVVTGGQHHNSSNWAVLVEQEDDNIGFLSSLFIEETQENKRNEETEKNLKAATKGLSPNAPAFIPKRSPDGKQILDGKIQQDTAQQQRAITTVQKKQPTDKELLDALLDVNPITMRNIHDPDGNSGSYRNNLRHAEFFDSDEEEHILDTCYKNSAREAGISPRHQRSGKSKYTNKSHGLNPRLDDEGLVPRQLPMRNAKQKVVASSTSTRPNRSKKK